MALCTLILLPSILYSLFSFNAQSSYGQSPTPTKSCYCVAFRLEDIQDEKYVDAQIGIMDVFKQKNASLTLGIIGNDFGQNARLVDYIKLRLNSSSGAKGVVDSGPSPPIAIANHGWNHENFMNFSLDNQTTLIKKTNDKIERIFGVRPSVFIPPLNSANNDTLTAVARNNMTFISSIIDKDPTSYTGTGNFTIYHIPQTAATGQYNSTDSGWHGISHLQTVKQIQDSIRSHGYAMVNMHPEEFSSKLQESQQLLPLPSSSANFAVNATEIKELGLLIDKIQSMGIKIVLIKDVVDNYSPVSEIIPKLRFSDFGGKGKYSEPEFEWYIPVGPTDLTFLRSDKLGKQYQNDLFVADVNLGNIYDFNMNSNRTGFVLEGSLADKIADTPADLQQITYARGFGGITDLEVGPDGYLYVLSKGQDAIFRIIPASTAETDNNRLESSNATTGASQMPIVSDSSLKTELVFKGFDFATSMAFLGPSDILVLEKNLGTIKRIVNGSLLPEPVLDVNVAADEGRGMLGIALAKNVNQTSGQTHQYAFVYFTESGGGKDGDDLKGVKPLGNRLYRYEFVGGKLVNPKLLLDLPAIPMNPNFPKSHMGGKVAIGPDQNVYVVIGDVGAVVAGHKTLAQNVRGGSPPDGTSGILRVTQDGNAVGSGILGSGHPLDKYYAYGIRNSFGIGFDPITGKLWDTENGPEFGDEINLVEPGFNSGYLLVQGNSLLLASTENKATQQTIPDEDLPEHVSAPAVATNSTTTDQSINAAAVPEFTFSNMLSIILATLIVGGLVFAKRTKKQFYSYS
jgi:glucose/arabinose dehydrogenase/peptidoglycan/xylan/chitin deacetylase (PgdA/CDA1 family)